MEGLSEEDREVDFKKSKFHERLEVFNNSFNIKIVLPVEKSENPEEDKEKEKEKEGLYDY